MTAPSLDWQILVPAIMIVAGFALLLAGLIARRRHMRAEEEQNEQWEQPRRPQMAPLPRLLSTARADHEE
ncbi:hypothetical protein FDV58_24870 [Bradyrhizobium elkanii]|uniref:Uncharacterized protein n=1 Tax=Bradyrhizobium elkanii TaxID=29448 RepID=A0A4U6RV00_BRAEL|nr:hypothetical protein [Bradyrhizobium elkanii]TKV78937.1 hypothetical protein FDV58_24870 [Bradyrhizobium elkanii]